MLARRVCARHEQAFEAVAFEMRDHGRFWCHGIPALGLELIGTAYVIRVAAKRRHHREASMGEKKRTPRKDFHPGGSKGKLHREMGIPEGQKIPASKLKAAEHSKNRTVRDDAIRAATMGKHKGRG
jgi:hypothetical protein